jgi:acetyl esterase
MPVLPSVEKFLNHQRDASTVNMTELEPAAARDYFDFFALHCGIAPRSLHAVEDVRIDTRDGAQITARIYYPSEPSWADPVPALLYFHSGGYVVGSLKSAEGVCRMLAADARCAVVSVDYRLAPEYRFPCAVNDAIDALCWLHREAPSLAIDTRRLAIGGESAGATLATVCAVYARDANIPLALQMLIYPGLSARTDTDAHRRYGEGYFVSLRTIHWIHQTYLASADDLSDWRFAPLDGEHNAPSSWTDLAPAWIASAECDPSQDVHLAYASKLRSHGNRAEIHLYPGMIHGFFSMGGVIPEAAIAHRDAVDTLRTTLGTTSLV